MRRGLWMTGVLLLTFLSAGAAAQRPAGKPPLQDPGPPPVEIRTTLSRTAAWVGDRVIYTVEFRCAPKFDILLDDVSRERIRVDGGELLGAEAEHEEQGGRVIRRLRYTIASFRVDAPALRVRAIPVRYYATRADGTAEGNPAGEVTVPAAVVAVRSTLPDGTTPNVRQPATLRPAPRWAGVAQPLGVALMAIAVIPLGMAALDVAGRVRRLLKGRTTARARREQRLSLEQLKEMTPSTDAARVDAFADLDRLIRDRLVLSTGVNAHALTPAEVRRVLEQRSSALPHDEVEALLSACESARYAPEPPTARDWERAIAGGEQILSAPRR